MIDLVEPELGDLFPGGNGGMLIAETAQGAQMMPFQLHEQEWNNMLIKNAHHLEFVFFFGRYILKFSEGLLRSYFGARY